MANTSKGPGPGPPSGRAQAPTVPLPGPSRPAAPAPGTSPAPGLAQVLTASWHQQPGIPQPPGVAPGTVQAGLGPPPAATWQQPVGLAPAPTTHTGPWHQAPAGTPQATGTHTASPAQGAPQVPTPTTQAPPAAGTRPAAPSSSRSRKRLARVVDRASSLIQSNQPASTLPVPNPHANTLPADTRREASASRGKTPDADPTIDELQQDQVFSVPTSSIDGMGRVVGYQRIGFGRSVIVATGPNRFCKYRIRPARDYGICNNKTDIPLVIPRPDAHVIGFALSGIAYQDKGDLGPAVLSPGTRQMPRTYIKVKWDDGAPDTWETRTILRKLMGKAVADQAIYDCASKFEWDARLFMENHPGWDQGDLVTAEPDGEGHKASEDEDGMDI
ncbi:hypothetical protein HOY82DRAFT_673335 [Tuber indicum]|nr:hypothetical protein HOY82DRAFT_673335 [Tuber indicum]